MTTQKRKKPEFDTRAAIRAIEEKKEAARQKKIAREQEQLRLQKEKEESDRLAEQENRLRFFDDERYFRLSLVDAIGALTQEVAHLRRSIENEDPREGSEAMRILRELASCIGYSDYSGLAHIRAKYIPKDYP